jgi:hypothetical protein
MNVFFNAFWIGFGSNPKTTEYFIRILAAVFNTDIEITTDISRAELLVESGFGPSVLATKSWRASFLFMGESWKRENWRDYTVVLSGQAETEGPNVISFPLYALYLYDKQGHNKISNNVVRPIPVNDVLVIVSNSGEGVRKRFLDELDKHFNVTYAGSYKNNIGGPLKPAYGTPEFFHYISKYKFVITMENSAQDSYITEKIFHGFFAHTVPVYWGAPRVEDYINPARFLHVRNGETAEFARVITEMKRLAADEAAWKSVISQPWEAPDKVQPTWETLAIQIHDKIKTL